MGDYLEYVDHWVLVIWNDARSTHQWEDEKGIPELSEIISVGLVVKMSDEIVVIAANVTWKDKQRSCVITIPTGSIKSIQEMTPDNYIDIPGSRNAGV